MASSLPQRRFQPGYWLVLGWLAVLFLTGGASRGDDPHQTVVRLAAIVVIILSCWSSPATVIVRLRWPLTLVTVAASIGILQLIPLPFGVWELLPGRAFYADIANASGVAGSWRPLTLTPDLTWNALLSLTVPLATIVSVGSLRGEERRALVLPLLVAVIADAALGLLQIADGPGSVLRFYRITNENSAVGFFANRNHHGMLLAVGIVLVGTAIRGVPAFRSLKGAAPILAIVTGAFLLLACLASGSRSGLIGCLIAIAGALLIYGPANHRQAAVRKAGFVPRNLHGLRLAALSVVAAALVWAAYLSGQAASLQRLFATDLGDESRLAWFPALRHMATAFFPFGSGLGSFDPVYRRFEAFDTLSTSYANQAHNDLMQLVIESGVFGLALLGIFLWWWSRRTIGIWRTRPYDPVKGGLARAGSLVSAMLLVFSLADYPLRTPLMVAIFTIACLWMEADRQRR